MKTLKLKRYGEIYTVTLVPTCYMNNKSLAIQIMNLNGQDWEPYGTLTTNISSGLEKNKAYVDTNNLGPEILDWIMENGLGEPTGNMKTSGLCQYPEVQFNEEALKQFDSSDYEQIVTLNKMLNALKYQWRNRYFQENFCSQKLTPHQKGYYLKTKTRDIAIITLFLGTGLRVSECVGLDISDVNFKNSGLRVIRKGGNRSAQLP